MGDLTPTDVAAVLRDTIWRFCGACGDPTGWHGIDPQDHEWRCEQCGAKTHVVSGP